MRTLLMVLPRLAAGQGHAVAQYNLGVMYENGRGVRQDYVEAIKWYRLAADQGQAEAITSLPILLHQCLFQPGTKVKLVGLKAAALNGKYGVVVAQSGKNEQRGDPQNA